MSSLRTFLVLGRFSNLPTVWSNCVAGWWLGGGGNTDKLPWLLAGATLLYEAGMFLNDAFDVAFDREHRPERPIPAGQISRKTTFGIGLVMLAAGLALLSACGFSTFEWGLFLALSILLYDAIHKEVPFSPVLMGLCRLLLYLTAASVGSRGITGWAMWCGLALAAYICGLSYFARRESREHGMEYWPLVLLLFPCALALVLNGVFFKEAALLLGAVVILWAARSLRHTLWSEKRNIGATISGLLAGIVLVDWLAIADAARRFGMLFLGLFILALCFQRVAPAT